MMMRNRSDKRLALFFFVISAANVSALFIDLDRDPSNVEESFSYNKEQATRGHESRKKPEVNRVNDKQHFERFEYLSENNGINNNLETERSLAALNQELFKLEKILENTRPKDDIIKNSECEHRHIVAKESSNEEHLISFFIKKFNPSLTDSKGRTALHIAAENGFNEIVKYLVKDRTLVNIPDDKGKTPAWYAANSTRWSTLAILIRSGGTLTRDIIELDAWNDLFENDVKLKELFFETTLVDPSSSSSAKVESVLIWACLKGYYELASFLIECGANTYWPMQGNSQLWLPLSRGNYEMANLLLWKGADIRAKDLHGMTLLHTASLLDEDTSIMQYLLDNGLDVNVRTTDGLTPLDLAGGAAWRFLRDRGGKSANEL